MRIGRTPIALLLAWPSIRVPALGSSPSFVAGLGLRQQEEGDVSAFETPAGPSKRLRWARNGHSRSAMQLPLLVKQTLAISAVSGLWLHDPRRSVEPDLQSRAGAFARSPRRECRRSHGCASPPASLGMTAESSRGPCCLTKGETARRPGWRLRGLPLWRATTSRATAALVHRCRNPCRSAPCARTSKSTRHSRR
jgi:hypothetical protein